MKCKKLIRRILFLFWLLTDVDFVWFVSKIFYRRVLIYLGNVFSIGVETVTVRVEQGELVGRKVTSVQGKTYYSFQGIPYAKPPIGPLRFKDPEPPDSWTGVRSALKQGEICIHKDIFTGVLRGSEDCLFLNIYTPHLPEKGVETEGKAVMFWIHGGGFYLGSGNAEVYGPDFLVAEDVILVTINYRLGALGFLSVGTEDAPGNAGLKDMVMALKWIKKNVAVFGGDPNNITIFGESAGGAAVQYLMLSPLAKGLFQRAISESGSAGAPWAFNPEMVKSSYKLGNVFGCDTSDPKLLVESLRKIPAKVIATKQNAALSEQNKRECIPFEFRPCIEPEGTPNAFITKHPRELIAEGKFESDVPYMTGINQMEGAIMLKSIVDKNPRASDLENDFERLVPRFLNLQYGSDESKEVAAKIREFYFKGKPLNTSTYQAYVDLSTDVHFFEPFSTTTRGFLKHMKSSLFNYYFLFEGDFNLFKKILNIKSIPGPVHSDELFYIFHVPILGQNIDPKTREMQMVKKMIRLWTNFAKYGNPTPDQGDEDLKNLIWPHVDEEDTHLLLNDQLSTSTHLLKERIDFWDKIKKQYCSPKE
ncbi:UNVERIFIED_CONTAM: hypothetical protein PYX00_006546 [Menopon gallinae]|uniref:Carboxylic ester hydrolase n=1 Tax=Menopon gallinae TaxID=328185 RepID=A0AAW2HVJ3_9NEOP